MASPTVAANAYANLARILDSGGAGKASEAGGPSFGAVLKDAIGSVLEAGEKTGAATGAMAPGQGNVNGGGTAGGGTARLGSHRGGGGQSAEHVHENKLR